MATLELKNEANYAARVLRVNGLVELPGLDNLRGVSVDGFMALVSKDTTVGSLVVAFVAESQLSEAFLSAHNLFRHFEKNSDPTQAGYIEDNRRVRAVKFRGHMSSALLMDAALLGVTDDQEGALFDTIDGVEISRKYYIKRSSQINAQTRQIAKAFKRVDDKMLPEHIETENYWRNSHLIPQDAFVTVTQKVHGSSIRIGNTIVRRQLKWWERALKRLGVRVQETDYDVVFGSRKVIKDPHNPAQNHFYSEDIWTREGEKYAHLIPNNIVLYAELIGWVGENSPIQGNYTYNVPNASPVPLTVSARTMVELCTCQKLKTSNDVSITQSAKPMPANFVVRATNAISGLVTLHTKRSGERTNALSTIDVETQVIAPLNDPSISVIPSNDVLVPLPSMVSQSKTLSDSHRDVQSVEARPTNSVSITTIVPEPSEGFSAISVTGESVSWVTLKRQYDEHLNTCRVRQELFWRDSRLMKQAECHLYVYRVAVVTADGGLYDLPWEGVKQFCAERDLNHVVELWSGRHSEFVAEDWIDRKFYPEYPGAVPLSKDSPVDEGVVVRWDGLVPTVLKAKSPIFLGHETALLDKEVVDIESVQEDMA